MVVEAYDYGWDEEADAIVVKDSVYHIGKLVTQDMPDWNYFFIDGFFEDFRIPIFSDFMGAYWIESGMILDWHDSSYQDGRFRYDTSTEVCVVTEDWLLSSENEFEEDIVVGYASDESVYIEESFAFCVRECVTKSHDDIIVSADTTWRFSQLYRNVRFMKPNGVHRFNSHAFTSLPSDNYVMPDSDEFSVMCLGYGGQVGRPIKPRPFDPTPQPITMNAGSPTTGDDCLDAGAVSATVTVPEDSALVYMFQRDDSTLAVYNLYGRGIIEHRMFLHEDSTMRYPGQLMYFDDGLENYVFNAQIDENIVTLGNDGMVTPMVVTWDVNYPCGENGLADIYYTDNSLCYTNGDQFVLPTTLVAGDVDGDGQLSIDDLTLLIDRLLMDVVTDGADVNQDGNVNIDDVTVLIDMLLRS